MFKKFTKSSSHDKDFRSNFILTTLISVVLTGILLLCVYQGSKFTKILNTTEYVQGIITEGRIYAIENNTLSKIIVVNDKMYESPVSALPAHVKEGDTINIAVDTNGNIIEDKVYMVDGVLYKDGRVYSTKNKLKEVSFDEYSNVDGLNRTRLSFLQGLCVIGAVVLVCIIIAIWVRLNWMANVVIEEIKKTEPKTEEQKSEQAKKDA